MYPITAELSKSRMKHVLSAWGSILLISALSSSLLYGQDAKELHFDRQVAYNYKYIIDTNNKADIKEELMVLLLNDTLSLFASQKRLQTDSSAFDRFKNGVTYLLTTVVLVDNGVTASTNYQIFKSGDKIRTLDAVNGKGVIGNKVINQYEESTDDFDWEILPDTLTIASYLCQKAKVNYGGRVWYAWFCPDIPLSDGPYTFSGLPGLIFQIRDEENYFQFDLMQIQNVNRSVWVNIRPDQTIEKINKKEFFRSRRNYQDNTYELGVTHGIYPPGDEKIRGFSKKSAMKNNNWIEKF